MNDNFDCIFRIILLGDSSTGKSCLLTRFTGNTFNAHSISTIGVDYRIKTLVLNHKTVRLQVWDTAGQERFRSITAVYYRNTHGVVLVYDICDRETFENIRYWKNSVLNHAMKTVRMILVGNKCDLGKDRVVGTQEGLEFAKECGIMFIEVSAKNGNNVKKTFTKITEALLRQYANTKHAKEKFVLSKTPVQHNCSGC